MNHLVQQFQRQQLADDVLSSDEKSKKWDWSHKLVGKVNKEILIPVTDPDDRTFLFTTMKQGCLDYLNYMIDKKRNNPWTRMGTGKKPTINNIHLTHSWVVSQYAGEYNPAWGLIEYAFGESQSFRCDNIKFKPEVGKFLVFPSWLKHLVYPFSVEGERRMMSFNATIINRTKE